MQVFTAALVTVASKGQPPDVHQQMKDEQNAGCPENGVLCSHKRDEALTCRDVGES